MVQMVFVFGFIDVGTLENDRSTYAFQTVMIVLIAYPAGLLMSRHQTERLDEYRWALWGVPLGLHGEALHASLFGQIPADPYVRSAAARLVQISLRRARSPVTVWVCVVGLAGFTGCMHYQLREVRPAAGWYISVAILAALATYASLRPGRLRRRLAQLYAGRTQNSASRRRRSLGRGTCLLPRLDSNQEPSD